jgi:hypothetical protein
VVYLRNRLAEYEVNVARYYVRRGAYLAAAQRAQDVVEQYDGAPAEREALNILADCYRRLGFDDLAGNHPACLPGQLSVGLGPRSGLESPLVGPLALSGLRARALSVDSRW